MLWHLKVVLFKQCAPSDLQFLLKMHSFSDNLQVLFSYILKIVVFSEQGVEGRRDLFAHKCIYLLLNFMIPFQYSFHV